MNNNLLNDVVSFLQWNCCDSQCIAHYWVVFVNPIPNLA